MDGVGALVWLHALLQGLRRWPALEVAQLFFWWLILLFLLGWTLLLARARLLITAEEPLPSRPSPSLRLLNSWPLAAALAPALLGLTPVVPLQLQTLLRGTLLLAIAVVSLYGQTRTQIDQQREQRLQLLAFADRTADLFRAEGNRRAEAEQQRTLRAALAAEEAKRS
jgi:hypothetical protein